MREFPPRSRSVSGGVARRSRAWRPTSLGWELESRVVLSAVVSDGPPVEAASMPALTYAGAGQTLVTTSTTSADGTRTIAARRYDLGGTPLGGAMQVATSGVSTTPVMGAANAGGQTVLAWIIPPPISATPGMPMPNAAEVHAQLFSSTGLALSPDLTLGKTTLSGGPVVAIDGSGDFVVAYTQIAGDVQAPVARGYRAATSQLSDPLPFDAARNTVTYEVSAVGLDDSGRFVAAWTRSGSFDPTSPDGGASSATPGGLYIGRFDTAGHALGTPELVTSKVDAANVVELTSLAVDPSGAFAYGYRDASGLDTTLVARRFDAQGAPAGQNVLVSRVGVGGLTTTLNGKPLTGKLAPARTEIPVTLKVNASGGFATSAIQGDPLKGATQVIRAYGVDGTPKGSLTATYVGLKEVSIDPSSLEVGQSMSLLPDGRVLLLQGERSVPLSPALGYDGTTGYEGTISLNVRAESPSLTPSKPARTTAPAKAAAPKANPLAKAQAQAAKKAAAQARHAARHAAHKWHK